MSAGSWNGRELRDPGADTTAGRCERLIEKHVPRLLAAAPVLAPEESGEAQRRRWERVPGVVYPDPAARTRAPRYRTPAERGRLFLEALAGPKGAAVSFRRLCFRYGITEYRGRKLVAEQAARAAQGGAGGGAHE